MEGVLLYALKSYPGTTVRCLEGRIQSDHAASYYSEDTFPRAARCKRGATDANER